MSLVSGTIFVRDTTINTDIIVKVFDVNLIGKQLLGQVALPASFANGSFRVTYTKKAFGKLEGSAEETFK